MMVLCDNYQTKMDMYLDVILVYYDRKRNVRRKVLHDGDDNDGDAAVDLGNDAQSQVSHNGVSYVHAQDRCVSPI